MLKSSELSKTNKQTKKCVEKIYLSKGIKEKKNIQMLFAIHI